MTAILTGVALHWLRVLVEPGVRCVVLNYPWPLEAFILIALAAMIWGIVDAFLPDKPQVEIVPPERQEKGQRRP